ncbi:MAG: ATP-dependent Clp protease adaptor ClpS [Spirochaetes bacterium]|nr:ATP-dependent Clp protease adaptor ClpS [Spirochaetota bacterium]
MSEKTDRYTDESTDIEEEIKEPSLYSVIMLNDHFSTMDFVVEMLVSIFRKNVTEATAIMYNIHQKGSGHCGHYTYDIALSKVRQVHNEAKKRGFPLKCTIERD